MRVAICGGGVIGEVTDIPLNRDGGDGEVAGVDIDGAFREADAVVIAMGPWSTLATRWLPLPDVYGLKGHSVVFRPKEAVPAEALFADVADDEGESDTPELFPRPDGTVYLCGLAGQDPLPVDPSAVETDPSSTARLRAMAAALSPYLVDAQIIAAQACYRPVTRDGLPLLGAVPGVEGAYVATGHSVWGILNAPASGEAMARPWPDSSSKAGQARSTFPPSIWAGSSALRTGGGSNEGDPGFVSR